MKLECCNLPVNCEYSSFLFDLAFEFVLDKLILQDVNHREIRNN